MTRPRKIVLLFAVLSFAGPLLAQDVNSRVAREEWEQVAKSLGAKPDLSVPERFLLGHAWLATNRTNQSLEIFAGTVTPEDLEAWDIWTAQFATDHPSLPVAHYLRGDALARSSKYPEALREFDQGLALSAEHPLLLHARGVAKASMGNLLGAAADLDAAVDSGSTLAATHESYAALWINRRTNVANLEKEVKEAIAHNDASILAHYDRWCLNTLTGHLPDAEKDRDEALQASPVFAPQLVKAFQAVSEEIDRVGDLEAKNDLAKGRDPGTVIQQRLDRFSLRGETKDLETVVAMAVAHPELQPKITQSLTEIGTRNPDRSQVISTFANLETHLPRPPTPQLRFDPSSFSANLFDPNLAARLSPSSQPLSIASAGSQAFRPAHTTVPAPQAQNPFMLALTGGYLFDRDYAAQSNAKLADSLWREGGLMNRLDALALDFTAGVYARDRTYSLTQAVTHLGTLPLSMAVSGLGTVLNTTDLATDLSQRRYAAAGVDTFALSLHSIQSSIENSRVQRLTTPQGQYTLDFANTPNRLDEARLYGVVNPTLRVYDNRMMVWDTLDRWRDVQQNVSRPEAAPPSPRLSPAAMGQSGILGTQKPVSSDLPRSKFIEPFANGLFHSTTTPAPPGGWDTDFKGLMWPDLEWPFRAIYSLYYPAPQK